MKLPQDVPCTWDPPGLRRAAAILAQTLIAAILETWHLSHTAPMTLPRKPTKRRQAFLPKVSRCARMSLREHVRRAWSS
jgi:hypothetical protein